MNKSRLRRKVIKAEWVPVDLNNNNYIRLITDAIIYGEELQINYKNSGWRSIFPYGWHSSKDGNILLMCYKDNGDIRSYRMDRINNLLINDVMLNNIKDEDINLNFEDFEIPLLPNMDEIIKTTEEEEGEIDSPFNKALTVLRDGVTDESAGTENVEDIQNEDISKNNTTEENLNTVNIEDEQSNTLNDSSNENIEQLEQELPYSEDEVDFSNLDNEEEENKQ